MSTATAEALEALKRQLFPVELDARRGPGLPPVLQPDARPGSLSRRRIRQLARGLGLLDVPVVFTLPITPGAGSAVGTVEFTAPDSMGPVLIVGIDGHVDATMVTAGTYTASIKCGDKVYTPAPILLGGAQFAAVVGALDPFGELPAPIVVPRKHRLAFDLVATGGTFIANAQIRLRAIVLRNPERSPAGAPADIIAEQLAAEGELHAVFQRLTSTTVGPASEYRAQNPLLWHGGSVSGLVLSTGTYRQHIDDTDLFYGLAGQGGQPQLPVGAGSLLWRGDLTQNVGERFYVELPGGTVDPTVVGNTIDALHLGRCFR